MQRVLSDSLDKSSTYNTVKWERVKYQLVFVLQNAYLIALAETNSVACSR